MTSQDNGREIFISYAWGGDSEGMVDEIVRTFAEAGFAIQRDKSHLNYRKSIRNFMDRIGRGKYIIVVVSDKYMKSEYCMYEAYRMFQSPEIAERIYPIVLPDADIFSFAGQQKYLWHWMTEVKKLEGEIKTMAAQEPTMLGPIIERLRDYEVTSRFVNDFMAQVADMNVLTPEMHLESNFGHLLELIENRSPQPHHTDSGGADADKQNDVGTMDAQPETASPQADHALSPGIADLENDFENKERLVEVIERYLLAGMPTSPRQMAYDLISRTYWPSGWKQLRISNLTENAATNARELVDFAIGRGYLPSPYQDRTALGNLLEKAKPLLSANDLALVDELAGKYRF